MGRLGVDKQLRTDGVRRLDMALGVKKEGDEPNDHLCENIRTLILNVWTFVSFNTMSWCYLWST